MEYGQFCPVAKATEILGEKWTMLIVRELLMGGTRFNELQRGLSLISPTILTKRLNDLAAAGVIVKKKIPGQRGHEYFLTEMGSQLLPIVKQVGEWGMRWARDLMPDSDLDVELLMLYLRRSVDPEKLPGNESVIRFKFSDLKQMSDWWLVVKGGKVELCFENPGKDVDVSFATDLRTMIEVWMGDISYRAAIADGRMKIVGLSALTRNVKSWLAPSIFAGIPPATTIA
jgi:DNA-binding HxlR family transcriptional regulator